MFKKWFVSTVIIVFCVAYYIAAFHPSVDHLCCFCLSFRELSLGLFYRSVWWFLSVWGALLSDLRYPTLNNSVSECWKYNLTVTEIVTTSSNHTAKWVFKKIHVKPITQLAKSRPRSTGILDSFQEERPSKRSIVSIDSGTQVPRISFHFSFSFSYVLYM